MLTVGKMETTNQTQTSQQSTRVQTHTQASCTYERQLSSATSYFRSKILRSYWIFVIRFFKQDGEHVYKEKQ
ncbi:unnamed protein product [Acanthoscelides obtectus]|uniref:Uncharacterized protein n=1 Tax=Acanthoscelides obtectus TaxID=200917 RepID=A0A9P0JSX1_ACAOB|nr:unnamed protein product [Acanthoscelides obtectus]CAK1668472.1 hypothetical protein AOBTE_LOCUS26424 [Acanthoscelides obtectus]